MPVINSHICQRSFGFFLLATDPEDHRFHMTQPVRATREEAEVDQRRVEGRPFVPTEWRRNPRAFGRA